MTSQEHSFPDADTRPPPAIVARGLRRVFGDEVALDRLDLEIEPATIFGFVGPSGSGKTTAVRLLTGIDQPTEGQVEVLGRPSSGFDGALRKRIGYMPQQSVLFPNLSVRENLTFVASLYGLPIRRRALLRQALEQTELYEHRRKPVRALSGGMQRRLALSAALVHHPDVLFLDEPTAGIDPVLRRQVWDRFKALRDEGHTLFVTTQYVGEAAYCDRVGVLSAGRLVADDTPDRLRRRALGGDVLELVPREAMGTEAAWRLSEVEGVRDVRLLEQGRRVHVIVDAAEQQLATVQAWCTERGIGITSLGEHLPPFDDVFAALMQEGDDEPVAAGSDR
ncbi:ABC transporter ATP-binding protein [Egibacter rhizosphaerae]|uniref:ABC transporter ATP-binding protein n=1 Tax=Egibacter rhizosphaerae TaxID=1670831 RepID=UPI0013F16036|nr:ABC transporter ATP-binding protein [Egibacter rhizosphaerae]